MARDQSFLAKREDVRNVKDCVAEIESVRVKRQAEVARVPHAGHKRFSQAELAQEACPTYKNFLTGRTVRVPSRDTLLKIAAYLECNIEEERNILTSAGYEPRVLWLRPDVYSDMVQQAIVVASNSSLPAYVFSPDMQMLFANQARMRLSKLPAPFLHGEVEQCLVGSCFRRDSYARYRNSPTESDWQLNGLAIMHFYRSATRPFHRESWFVRRIELLKRLPDFADFWLRSATTPTGGVPQGNTRNALTHEVIKESAVITQMGGPGGPSIYFSTPENPAARAVYEQLHLKDFQA